MSADPFHRYCIAPFDPLGFIDITATGYEEFDPHYDYPLCDEWVAEQKLAAGLYFSWQEDWIRELGNPNPERVSIELGCAYLVKDGITRRLQPGDLERPTPRVVTWPPK